MTPKPPQKPHPKDILINVPSGRRINMTAHSPQPPPKDIIINVFGGFVVKMTALNPVIQ